MILGKQEVNNMEILNDNNQSAMDAPKPSDGIVVVPPYFNLELRDFIIKFEETQPIDVPLYIILK